MTGKKKTLIGWVHLLALDLQASSQLHKAFSNEMHNRYSMNGKPIINSMNDTATINAMNDIPIINSMNNIPSDNQL